MPVVAGRPGAPSGGPLISPDELTAAVAAHNADTTAVHGITDTANLTRPPALADTLPVPLYVGHRGGKSRYPEHSMEGYRACAAAGFAIDCDVRALSDGTLVVQHDASLAATTDGSGNVADATLAEYLAARTDATTFGTTTAVPVLWDQVLDEFGGRNLIVVEAKLSAVADDLITSITSRGLGRAVILASSNYGDCTDAADAGVAAMYVADAPTPYTWAAIAAAGVEHVAMSTSVVTGDVSAAQAEGLKVHIFTVSTLAGQTTELAKSPDGLFTDDPWWLTGRYAKGDREGWADGVPWPGMIKRGTAMKLRAPRQLSALVGSSTSGWTDTRGLFGTKDASSGVVKVRGRVRFRPYAVNQTRWAGVFVGVTGSETVYDDTASTAGQAGYTCLIKRDGTLQVYYYADSSAASSLGSTAGTLIADASEEGEALVEFEVNTTHVVLRNLTTNEEFSNAHTTHRSAVSALSLGFNGTDVEWSDVTFYKAS